MNIDFSRTIARRCLAMGLTRNEPSFPEDGVSLFELVPWWSIWPRDPMRHSIRESGAAIVPATISGVASFGNEPAIQHSVFAALLPIQSRGRALEQWTQWALANCSNDRMSGLASSTSIIKRLLEDRPEHEATGVWRRILDGACRTNKRATLARNSSVFALLENIQSASLKELTPYLLYLLRGEEPSFLLMVMATLARLNSGGHEIPAEDLLARLPGEVSRMIRSCLAFIETEDLDLLPGLMLESDWLARVQCLRLIEAGLIRRQAQSGANDEWRLALVEFLMAQLEKEEDCDVLRRMSATLGLSLKGMNESAFARAISAAPGLEGCNRLESLLNGLVIAQIPGSFASQIEDLRGDRNRNCGGVRPAVNRVLMSMGFDSGSVLDWLDSDILASLEMGALELNQSAGTVIKSPGECPEEDVVACLLDRPNSGIVLSFVAAHLTARPGFTETLERMWSQARVSENMVLLQSVGCLLAAAGRDCDVTAAELRCCLGANLGGPLPDTPENVGRLLRLVGSDMQPVCREAETLLLLGSPATRIITSSFMNASRETTPFLSPDYQRLALHAGSAPARGYPFDLPTHLQPVLKGLLPAIPNPHAILRVFSLPGVESAGWVRSVLPWKDRPLIQEAFLDVDDDVCASGFLLASSSDSKEMRECAAQFAAAIGPRLLRTPNEGLVCRRIVQLAAYDGDGEVMIAAREAACVLGIADRLPELPPIPAPQPEGNKDSDFDLDDLLMDIN